MTTETESGLASLREEFRFLQVKVDRLAERLEALEAGAQKAAAPRDTPPMPATAAFAQEDVLTKVDRGAFLPRLAAVCFMLVIALLLRTITDSKIIDTTLGSVLGMAYAIVLIAVGWRLYGGKSRLAPVFPACGLLLLFSIVLETHGRYQSLSTFWAYVLLLAGGASTVVMGLRYRASMLTGLGIVGILVVSLLLDFPYPVYPLLGILLIAANLASFITYRCALCRYLRWVTLAFTAFYWLFWSFKSTIPAACDEPLAVLLHLSWFFPFLILFGTLYFIGVVLNVHRNDSELGFYEGMVPTIVAVGGFAAGQAVVGPWHDKTTWLGLAALVLAGIHLGAAWWFAGRDKVGARGSNSFAFAGVCLFVLGSAAVVENVAWVLPFWSAAAFGLALVSDRWHSGGVRITSYLLQFFTCFYGVASGAISAQAASPAAAAVAAATMAVCSLLQFRWCRRYAPAAEHSAYFSWLDKKDLSGVVLLAAGLISGFYFAQVTAYYVLSRAMDDPVQTHQSVQSICINLGAVLLMVAALKRRSVEFVVMACLVAMIGAVKVFIFDLFGIKGVPLMISVFSFGVVAAAASVVMGRWQKEAAS